MADWSKRLGRAGHRLLGALRRRWLVLRGAEGLRRASIRAALPRAETLEAGSPGPGRHVVLAEPRLHRLPNPRHGWDDETARRLFTRTVTTENHGWVYATPPVTMARIKDARLVGSECGLITNDHRFIGQPASFTTSKSLLFSGDGSRAWLLDTRPPPRLAEAAVLMWDGWAGNYYHWLVEFLPRLGVLARFPELSGLPVVVGRWSGFHGDSLALSGIARERALVHPGGVSGVGQLYVPSPLSGMANGDEVAWLRANLLPRVKHLPGRRRLYVSRRDARSRRVANEDAVMAVLEPLGFDLICPGALPFAEQVRLFAEAEIVVGVHGAGLANVAFMPPGGTLIELFAASYLNGCYWALAAAAGVDYGLLVGEPVNATHDFAVDPRSLQAVLDACV